MMRMPASLGRCGLPIVALLVSSLFAFPVMAQVRLPAATPDTNPALTAFRRAQRLVNDGHGGPGRFVVDSLVEVAATGSAAEAQALFWRATLAPTWAEAQRDYLRVMLEHERSPLAAESMFRLAQGELAGGDRAAALRYFERIAREAPEAPIRSEASLWHGRMLIERGGRATGCPVLREGRRRVREMQVELVNQYDYLLQGCPAESGAPTGAVTVAPSTTPQWSVQLAAFQTRGEAEEMITRLGARGYGALRIDGEAPPFRVRMGRFATRAEAQRALVAYRTKEKSGGFVTTLTPP
jgi:hypothetical protein